MVSKPPIYPRGYDPDYTVQVRVTDRPAPIAIKDPYRDEWPYMLGLLTIIGDAVRGVPWGKPSQSVASPVLPEVGSVWLRRGGSWPVVVMGAGPALQTRYVCMEGGGAWQIDSFYGAFIPATVIPTPTADHWINPADELPAAGQDIWRWTADAGTYLEVMWSADIEHWRQVLAAGGTLTWRWMPFPPGVIPPPPANREQTGAERYLK